MAEQKEATALTVERRREIFLALVEAQDQKMSVSQSRKFITEQFSISEDSIRQIEREGMEQQWPPLG